MPKPSSSFSSFSSGGFLSISSIPSGSFSASSLQSSSSSYISSSAYWSSGHLKHAKFVCCVICAQRGHPHCVRKDKSGSGSKATSPHPIRYANGALHLEVNDLTSSGFGQPWGHTRSYSNQLFDGTPGTNGNGWYQEHSPLLLFDNDGSVAMVTGPNKAHWYEPHELGGYKTLFGGTSSLAYDHANNHYIFNNHQGDKTLFFGDNSPLRGAFKGTIDASGKQTLAHYNNNLQLESYVQSSGNQTSGYHYEYQTGSANASPNQIKTITHKVNGQPVRRSNYEYHSRSETGGVQGDLKTAQVEQYDPATGSWTEISKSYYRYYSSFASPGFPSGLKFSVGPEAYSRMLKAGIQPEKATDSQLAGYADYYFEYDFYQRVTRETVNGGAQNYTFSYTESSNEDDFNAWAIKTVETLPDGNKNIVYTNYAGQAMLTVFVTDEGEEYSYYLFNDEGSGVLQAESSAVAGYDESKPWLVTLHSNKGLIHTWEYYSNPSDPGYAPGYMKHAKVQEGSTGKSTLLQSLKYVPRTAAGSTIYLTASEINYQSEENGGSEPAETLYDYTFFDGQLQVLRQTTTLPAVPLKQNGSGKTDLNVIVYDGYGNATWTKDERGFINYSLYDVTTGALIQSIADVDTSIVSGAPAGWSTPAGGGLNLVTDYQFDAQGRTTQQLGPVHTVDLEGTATAIRRAAWTVYRDDIDQQWQGKGYATGNASSYEFTLINPVSITQMDQGGRVTDAVEAIRESVNGALSANDNFPQTSWSRWSRTAYDDWSYQTHSRFYFIIPKSGEGVAGTNYNETKYGYDVLGRQNRVVTPGGTITRKIFLPCGCGCDCQLVLESWTGTSDTGATDIDPSGGGTSGNNMVLITLNEYDDGEPGGDENLTKTTQYVDAESTRVTKFGYDFRNRKIYTDGEVDFYESYTYDNLNRVIRTDRRDTTHEGNLVSRSETKFDSRGQNYQTITYGVDPSTGEVGNTLRSNIWYDPSGRAIKELKAGSQAFTKTIFDGVGRKIAQYTAYNLTETGYPYPIDVSGDTVIEQTESSYDGEGNVVAQTTAQRFHDAMGTGSLNGPNGAEPKARVSYVANYLDPLGRQIVIANYGTNGTEAWLRPEMIPAASDTVLVSATAYNDRGEAYQTTDPQGRVSQFSYDDAQQLLQIVENFVLGGTGADQNRTTQYTYNPDGKMVTLTAKNVVTGDQVTQWIYGATLTDSDVASHELLREKRYPGDTASSPDRISYAYDRLGEIKESLDQNGSVHVFDYDLLGRLAHDRVTVLAKGVNGAVRRISKGYEVRGMLQMVTSFDEAEVGAGRVLNEVFLAYDSFQNLVCDYQAHVGLVDPASTLSVQYTYADGSNNTVRQTGIIYPNGNQLAINYSSSEADVLSRPDALVEGGRKLCLYKYLGLSTQVKINYDAAGNLHLTYENGGTGDAGDKYTGLDRFGRLLETIWKTGRKEHVRSKYGRNRLGGLTWRQDEQAHDQGVTNQDNYYSYDGLQQVKQHQRGDLIGTYPNYSGVSNPQQDENWTYDSTGNWDKYSSLSPSNNQTRTQNQANEITGIISPSGEVAPKYDATGNIITMPIKPGLSTGQYALTWDAWNRLVEVRDDTVVVAAYVYDGLTRRITKSNAAEVRHYYFNSEWRALEERVEGADIAVDRQYAWGLIDRLDLVRRTRSTGGQSLNEELFLLRDGLDPVAIAGSDGNVVERYGYDAFGETLFMGNDFGSRSRSEFNLNLLFHGEFLDEETNLYNYGYRYYFSHLGRWLSRDPIGEEMFLQQYASSGASRLVVLSSRESLMPAYRFNRNNALHYVDQFGLTSASSSTQKDPCNENKCVRSLTVVFTSDYVVGELKIPPKDGKPGYIDKSSGRQFKGTLTAKNKNGAVLLTATVVSGGDIDPKSTLGSASPNTDTTIPAGNFEVATIIKDGQIGFAVSGVEKYGRHIILIHDNFGTTGCISTQTNWQDFANKMYYTHYCCCKTGQSVSLCVDYNMKDGPHGNTI